MTFTLIVCTYNRLVAIKNLMQSVQSQTFYPNQILIVDSSLDKKTHDYFLENQYKHLEYFKVTDEDKGLTKQRNFGIQKVKNTTDFVCFLDDDVVLEADYFEQIHNTYLNFPEAYGVGGYITNEVIWNKCDTIPKKSINTFYFDGFFIEERGRFKIRRLLGLDANVTPGFMPLYSHGRSLSFLPPSGKIYEVEQLMGGVSSFRKKVLEENKFSTFFEGYGLYEDADFTIRVSKKGQLYCNTNAKLAHYHDPDGRPNQYKYGKMVVKNGWYVWRVKNPNPCFIDRYKWNAITLILMILRGLNVFTSSHKKQAFTEFCGRLTAYVELIFVKPKVQHS
jgi:glycosyltransferase involved in cell wall biosynthesis